MKKLFTLFAAATILLGVQNAKAQTDVEYNAALAAIESGASYYITTDVSGTKYYLTNDGHLTNVQASAGTFTVTQSTNGAYKSKGFKIHGTSYFSNPPGTSDSNLECGYINRNNEGRDTWDAQVLFLNSNGKYAVRCTNAATATSSWGYVGNAYWTVAIADVPVAQYSFTVNYIWKFEKPGDVTYTALSATKFNNGEGAEKLIDGAGNSKWGETLTTGNPRWLIFKTDRAINATKYMLTVANDTPNATGRQWTKWKIYGANFYLDRFATNDATEWVLLDQKNCPSDTEFPTGSGRDSYSHTDFTMSENNSGYYQYFKIVVEEIRTSGQYSQMGDFRFKTFTAKTESETWGIKIDVAKTKGGAYDFGALGSSYPLYSELQSLIATNGGLDTALAGASGDYTTVESKLESVYELQTMMTTYLGGKEYIAINGSATWNDGHWTQLVDGGDGIDGRSATKWGGDFSGTEGDAGYVQYCIFRVKTAFAPYFYKLVTGNDTNYWTGRNWKTWSVYGGNFSTVEAAKDANSSTWVLLDERTDISETYLPMENNYPAAFDFNKGVNEDYYYYMVKVFAAHDGNKTQMNEMYLCTQEEFETVLRAPLVAYFDGFDGDKLLAAGFDLATEVAQFDSLYAELTTTADAVHLTEVYNEMTPLYNTYLKAPMELVNNVPAVDGVYQIGTAAQLAYFSNAVNKGYIDFDAVLTADIDMSGATWEPIGNWSSNSIAYTGHFDGQGHTISNLTYTAGKQFHCLFGVVAKDATIENFTVRGKLTTNGNNQLGVIGYAGKPVVSGWNLEDTNVTIRNIHSYMDIEHSGDGQKVGGIVGTTNPGPVNIIGCTYSGEFKVTDSGINGNYGGIVGLVNNSTTTITNCLFDGTLYNTETGESATCAFGGMAGFINASSTTTIENCLSVGTITSTANGQICGALKANATYTNNYYKGTNVNGPNSTVTKTATAVTDAQLAKGEICYQLNNGGTAWTQTIGTDTHPVVYPASGAVRLFSTDNYTNLPITDGKIQIGSADDLKKFSAEVNVGNNSMDAVLNADVAPTDYTPIGTDTYKYAGTFDGQGHSVTLAINSPNTYQGLFGNATGGAVFRNFIVRGSVTGGQCTAALVGEVKGGGTITVSNVGLEATVSSHASAASKNYIAAFVGNDYGYQVTMNIENCYNIGDVTGSNPTSVIGACTKDGSTFKNVYNIGNITNTNGSELFFSNYGTCINCYTTEEGSHSGLKSGVSSSVVTSGELCYKLGAAFRQVIGTDTYPKLGTGNGIVILNDTYQNASSTISFDEDNDFGTSSDFNVNSVTMDRTLAGGKWETFCVPFDMTSEEITSQLGSGVTVKELTAVSEDDGDYTLTFSDASSIEAGKSYMVKVPSDVTSISLGSKTIKADISETAVNDIVFTGKYYNGYAPFGSFVVNENTASRVQGTVALKAFRGYLVAADGKYAKTLSLGLDGIEDDIEPLTQIADSLTFAVLGNSISTYYDYIPSGYAIYYSSDREKNNNIQVGDTWWMQLSRKSGLSFLANASWSGSRVAFAGYSSTDIGPFCSEARVKAVGRAGNPDFIFIAGGTNDWAHGTGPALGEYNTEDSLTFRGAYTLLLRKLTTRYPKARIVCLSIFPRAAGVNDTNGKGWSQADGNASIQHIAGQFDHCYYIDCTTVPWSSNWSLYTLDQLHPSAAGSALLAEHIANALVSQDIIGADVKRTKEVETADCLLDISFTEDGIVNSGTYNATVGANGATTTYDATHNKYLGTTQALASNYFYATYDEGSSLANAFNGSVTWEMLVRLDDLNDQNGNATKTCIMGSEQDGGWCFYNSDYASTFSYSHKSGVKSSVKNYTGDYILKAGKFYHLVVTMDRTSHIIRYYVNGRLVRTGTRAGSDMPLPQCGAIKGHQGMWICLGGDVTSGTYDSSAENSSACSFVYARIYDGALSETAAINLYNDEARSFTCDMISNASELVAFANKVNGGDSAADALLTADIDMSGTAWGNSIGNWVSSAAYCGHFNGQGHTISNFTYTTNREFHGLFGVLAKDAIVENLTVSGTVTNNAQNNIGIIGYAGTPSSWNQAQTNVTIRNVKSCIDIASNVSQKVVSGLVGRVAPGTVNIERCTYSGNLTVADNGNGYGAYGGIAGYVEPNTACVTDINLCTFDGSVTNTAGTPGDCTLGGIVGRIDASAYTTIENCVSGGTVTSKISGKITGTVNSANAVIKGCYYNGGNVNGAVSNNPSVSATSVSDAQITKGEVAYKLNGDQSNIVWTQTIGADKSPVPFVAPLPVSQQVYEAVSNTSYTNHPSNVSDGKFLIATGTDLKNFAVEASAGNTEMDAELTADINLDGIAWTPIGNISNAYTGTFDGAGYSISNFSYTSSSGNAGLFGKISNATVQDFSIGGTLTLTGGKYSGVIAQALASTVSNVHSSLTVDVTGSGVAHVGGVVGSTEGGPGTTISGCSYAGIMTIATGNNDCHAGVVGYMSADNVINCANYGSITFHQANCFGGGVVGYINTTSASVKNCLNTGTIAYDGEGTATYGGAIVGRLRSYDVNNLTNNYWLGSSASGAGKNDSGNENLSTATEVTTSQLASGEVVYKLNESTCYEPNWFQTLGTDDNPVLYNSHGIVNKISAAGYTTQYIPTTDVTIPTGVEAFVGVVNGEWLRLVPVEDEISKEDAVILRGDEGYYSFMPTTGVEEAENNNLVGSDGTVTGGDDIYALAKKNDVVGFYLVNSGVTVPAGKAYLNTSAGVKGFFGFAFDDDDPDAIVSPLGETEEGVIYNLAGQRISKLQKGINIINGKKVLK